MNPEDEPMFDEKTTKTILELLKGWASESSTKPDKICTLCKEACYHDEHICPICSGYNFKTIDEKPLEVPKSGDKL